MFEHNTDFDSSCWYNLNVKWAAQVTVINCYHDMHLHNKPIPKSGSHLLMQKPKLVLSYHLIDGASLVENRLLDFL